MILFIFDYVIENGVGALVAQRLQLLGGLRTDLPLPLVLRSFIGLFFSYVITDMLMGSQLPASARQHALDHFLTVYLHGILAEG